MTRRLRKGRSLPAGTSGLRQHDRLLLPRCFDVSIVTAEPSTRTPRWEQLNTEDTAPGWCRCPFFEGRERRVTTQGAPRFLRLRDVPLKVGLLERRVGHQLL